MKKSIIAVDIDDVLASSAEYFVDYCNKKWGTRLTVEDYTEHWAELWGVDLEEADRRAQHVYNSNMQAEFNHIDQAKPVLVELAKRYKLVIVTSRHRLVQDVTLEWIERYFKGIFSEIHFAGIWDAGHPAEQALNLTKAQISQEIGADYLIDDHPKHCIGAASVGIKTLLYGDYAWSRDCDLPDGIVRVNDWQAVREFFDAEI